MSICSILWAVVDKMQHNFAIVKVYYHLVLRLLYHLMYYLFLNIREHCSSLRIMNCNYLDYEYFIILKWKDG